MHHLILVRERDAQVAASGCCGVIDGDAVRWDVGGGGHVFAERRRAMERTGEIYRAVRDRYGAAVRISVVDPRDPFSLGALVIGAALRHRIGLREAFRTVRRIGPTAVVVDGVLVAAAPLPSTAAVLRRIAARIDRAREPVHA
ncbi:MAG: hypothetical protein ACOC8B_08650 [Gemmatimonadota bacterium]